MLLFAASAAFASAPHATDAGCGGVQTARPPHWHKPYRPPLAIGDSTMLLALPVLAREGFAVNAHGCREYSEALQLLRSLRRAHALPHLVVVALGGDGSVTAGDVEQTLRVLGPGHVLVLVTPRELGGGSNSNAVTVRAEGRRHPQRVQVLDWVAYSAGHGDWFQPDGLHLTFPGADVFARFLARVLPLAAPPTPAPKCPAPPSGPQTPLATVTLDVPGGVLHVAVTSGHVQATLANDNAFALSGTMRIVPLNETAPIALACVSAPASSQTPVTLTLTPQGLEQIDLRQRFPVRLVASLFGPSGQTGSVSGTYLLARPRR